MGKEERKRGQSMGELVTEVDIGGEIGVKIFYA